jgi:hypothetical protein
MSDKALSELLQDIGYEFGCPSGVRVTDWLPIVLKKARIDARRAEGQCDGCSEPLEDAYCVNCAQRALCTLDFKPSPQREIADMANVGNAYMDALTELRPEHPWNTCPVEIFRHLCDEVDECRKQTGIETPSRKREEHL